VIQHTASPEATIAKLAAHLKPGGCLVIDHYTRGAGSRVRHALSYFDMAYPVRAVLRHVKPERAVRVTNLLTAVCDPIRRQTSRVPVLGRITQRILPTASYYRKFPELDRKLLYEWHQLDTFDWLTDWYKHFRTPDQIRKCLDALGLQVEACELAGNGVEARAVAPLQARAAQ